MRRILVFLGVIAVALMLSAGLLWKSDSEHADRTAAAEEARAAAREYVPRIYSYQYDTVDAQLADVEQILTDPYRTEFSNTARTRLAPLAKQLRTTTEARIVGDAILSAGSDEVTLLLFMNQQTIMTVSQQSLSNGYSLRTTLVKNRDGWRISRLAVL